MPVLARHTLDVLGSGDANRDWDAAFSQQYRPDRGTTLTQVVRHAIRSGSRLRFDDQRAQERASSCSQARLE
jgi:hypothetical protein